jgi:hypothetical protein
LLEKQAKINHLAHNGYSPLHMGEGSI